MFFLFANTLAISDASLVRYTFRCPGAKYVFLKSADVKRAVYCSLWCAAMKFDNVNVAFLKCLSIYTSLISGKKKKKKTANKGRRNTLRHTRTAFYVVNLAQTQMKTLLPSLNARRWVDHQTKRRLQLRA